MLKQSFHEQQSVIDVRSSIVSHSASWSHEGGCMTLNMNRVVWEFCDLKFALHER